MKTLAEKIERNAVAGADLVMSAIMGEVKVSEQVKLASMAITQHCKLQATKGAFETLKYAVGRSISKDIPELKKYIQTHMPGYIDKRTLLEK
jgi:hypothetical protein